MMITTVRNQRGYMLMAMLLLVTAASTCVAGFCGYTGSFSSSWFVVSGVAVGLIATTHQLALLVQRRAFTRLTVAHGVAFAVYAVALLCSLALPRLSSMTVATEEEWRLNALLTLYVLQVPGLTVMAGSFFFAERQRVQQNLHPQLEIIDGYAHSSKSIQMKRISKPSAGSSKSSLKQVVVDQVDDADRVDEGDLDSSRHPAPSQVLRKWPRGDPFPVRALYSFKASARSELSFRKGDTLIVTNCRGRWWEAEKDGATGFVPSNYLDVLKKGRVMIDFDPVEEDEVAVVAGQTIEVMELFDEKSLIRTVDGKIGAVPTSNLQILDATRVEMATEATTTTTTSAAVPSEKDPMPPGN